MSPWFHGAFFRPQYEGQSFYLCSFCDDIKKYDRFLTLCPLPFEFVLLH